MKKVKGILVGTVAAVLGYLVVVIFFPVLDVPKQPFPRRRKESGGRKPPPSRQDVQFDVDGTTIRAWLYLPQDTSQPVPSVVMSTGFGGTKEAVIERYALRFVEAGLAVLTYDYRHFGESDGEPRQLFDTSYQLDDLRAAVAYARSREEIDPEKIILWSTSAAGGYGLVIAAEDERNASPQRIAGVIAQCPSIDHDADGKLFMKREGWGYIARLFVHAQRDKGRSRFGLSPHTIPIVGRPGTMATLTAPGAFEGYAGLVEESETFKNEVCARMLFMGHGRDPIEAAADVQCPVLFLVCEYDNLASPQSHVRAAEALGDKATVKSYPIGHFDIYEGEHFEEAVNEKIAFIEKACR